MPPPFSFHTPTHALTAAKPLILIFTIRNEYALTFRNLLSSLTRGLGTGTYTENPFASTHSLDANPFDDPTPARTSPAPSYPSPNHASRLEELNQRERDLERREAELNQKADHIRRFGRNNWPRCMSTITHRVCAINPSFSVYPVIFHSIKDEIPEQYRPLITRLYQLWFVLFGTLIVNFIACIFILTSGSPNGGSDLGSSIGYVAELDLCPHGVSCVGRPRYMFVITPLSFLLWYRYVLSTPFYYSPLSIPRQTNL